MIGIKIARRGKDLAKANKKDLVMSTELETLPIALQQPIAGVLKKGIHFTNPGEAQLNLTIAHNLGFEPLFRVWMDQVQSTGAGPFDTSLTGKRISLPAINGGFSYYATSDKTNIYVTIDPTGVVFTYNNDLTVNGYLYLFSKRVAQ